MRVLLKHSWGESEQRSCDLSTAQHAAASVCDREKKTGEEDQRWMLKVGATEEEFSLCSSRASVHVPSVATVTHSERCGAATSFPVPTVLLATRLNLSVSFFLSFLFPCPAVSFVSLLLLFDG